MSATDLGFADESFDFIFAHQVLEHINDYPIVLGEFRRLCRPGGSIYINVPNPLSPMIGKLPNGEWPRPLHRALGSHVARMFRADFLTDTEKYHTGVTRRTLSKHLPGFRVHDLRRERLSQELGVPALRRLIDALPAPLLSLIVTTNIWLLTKDAAS